MTATLRYSSLETALIRRLRSPDAVEDWLRSLPYNKEAKGETLRSFRGVVRDGTAHCLEGALSAAAILEAHGYSPLLLDIESADNLDHVVFLYRTRTGWGTVATSRFPGLKGRKPVYASPRALAYSYADPFFDFTGRVNGYGILDLRTLPGSVDWRFSPKNVWAVQTTLIGMAHTRLRISRARERRWRLAYRAFKKLTPALEPPASFYADHLRWR
jgi:hypothetical protein